MKKSLVIIILCLSMFPITGGHAENGESPTVRLSAVQAIESGSSITSESCDLKILSQFSDFDVISSLASYEQRTLAVMIEKGVLHGYEDNTLRPLEPLTRAEYAVMLYRAQPYFDELPKLVDYFVPYADVSGWNAEAVRFCVEHGLMMGDGTKFGVEDNLTGKQVRIVQERMQEGLDTAEKYTLLSLNGVSPINMTKINQSVYDEKLANNIPPSYFETTLESKQSDMKELQDYIDIVYNFDYREYNSEEKLQKLANRIANLSESNASKRDDENYDNGMEGKLIFLKENMENGYVAESFFVTAPHLYWWHPQNAGGKTIGAQGYFYFKIDSGMERAAENNIPIRFKTDFSSKNNPDRPDYDLEQGKWYRQMIRIEKYKSQISWDYTVSGSETIEPLPDDFYN